MWQTISANKRQRLSDLRLEGPLFRYFVSSSARCEHFLPPARDRFGSNVTAGYRAGGLGRSPKTATPPGGIVSFALGQPLELG